MKNLRSFRQHYRDALSNGADRDFARWWIIELGASPEIVEAVEYLESDEHESELE